MVGSHNKALFFINYVDIYSQSAGLRKNVPVETACRPSDVLSNSLETF